MTTVTQSRVSLAKIKHAEFASEETHCFSAEVIFDGRVVARVSNDGHGGSDMWHPARAGQTMSDVLNAKMDIDAFGKTLPPHVCGFSGVHGSEITLPIDADLIIGELIEEWSRAKHEKNRIKRAQKLLATKTTVLRGGQCFTYKCIVPDADLARILAAKPGEVLNGLPFAEAFAKLEAAHAI